ncbi:DUF72 domain-containing protein [Lentimicrobium sp.]
MDLKPAQWFTFYCEYFKTIELNVTFYKFPTAKMLSAWYNKSPKDFLFIVKAPRLITHYKKFTDCTPEISDFYDACGNGLQEKLGCLLFQFPPSFKYTEQTLDLVLNNLKPEFNNVIEFRDISWWKQDVYEAFKANNITFCSVSHPTMPDDFIVTAPRVYIRLHGSPRLFHSSYPADYLRNLHEKLISFKTAEQAYVIFNNTAGTAGILNAQEFENLT